jgi:hypothetical protein
MDSQQSTVQLINAVLSSALKRAVRLKLVEHKVCKDVQTPRIQREEVEVFDRTRCASLNLSLCGGIFTRNIATTYTNPQDIVDERENPCLGIPFLHSLGQYSAPIQ